MKKVLLAAAVLGLSAGGAFACPYSNSAKATDKMTVASVDDKAMSDKAMSKPDKTTTSSVTTETKPDSAED